MLSTVHLSCDPINIVIGQSTEGKHSQVSQYQKGKTNLDFNKARDSEWQWHQLGHMQVCTSLQTDNHASTPPVLCISCINISVVPYPQGRFFPHAYLV